MIRHYHSLFVACSMSGNCEGHAFCNKSLVARIGWCGVASYSEIDLWTPHFDRKEEMDGREVQEHDGAACIQP